LEVVDHTHDLGVQVALIELLWMVLREKKSWA
jgi:hypothetical protein